MNPSDFRLPAVLEAAVGHVKATMSSVAERVAAGLGSQSQSSTKVAERDLLLATQIELRRKMNTFHMSFTKVLNDKVQEEAMPRHAVAHRPAATDWQSLSLVDDHELEQRMFSGRIGQQITHTCEWELREVAAYMGTVLGLGRADEERNPLRADVIGAAVYSGVEAVTSDPEGRKLLARELGHAMAQAMPACYAGIVRDLQLRNVQPVGLTVKTVDGPGNLLSGVNTGYESMRSELHSTRSLASDFHASLGGELGSRSTSGAARSMRSGSPTQPASLVGAGNYASGVGAHAVNEADAQLMTLLRRLTFLASRPGALDTASSSHSTGGYGNTPGRGRSAPMSLQGAGGPLGGASYSEGLTGLMAVNLIRAHREELVQASTGKLDHMVIDVVGSLFDQILSDPRVPPQMARQIARLQLPVLRVALVDQTFFSSRRHPVRRFVNRIASLACAFDDFDDGPGKQFLDRVRELVQEIVEGDFDQVELYTSKLTALESFITGQTEDEAKTSGAASVLESKESELRVQQRYMLHLQSALGAISMPDYLRNFTSQVWSQALVAAVRRHGADSDLAKRFKQVGRDLVMSVQPKGSPTMRKRFLMQLPGLMRDLNEGMKLIGWPDAAQKDFFARLLPSHAESMKAPPLTELDHNMLSKQLESIFGAPIPRADQFSSAEPVALPSQEIEQRFSPDEAQRVGLVEEATVDWSGEVDIDLSADVAEEATDTTDAAPLDLGLGLDINLDLATADPAEPSHGARLIDHIRLGFAYQMLLKDQWQKVRLSYVSPGRSFFVFTRGRKHQESISLTSRMLARMCESNRMRAVESAYLMERATARARKQLAALKANPSKH
ncbi:DUF1631 family protein [Piscinibacter sp.]|jgi:hypothetical protein|uniref:DUF1631 family protein n=1 Tax=Piscinibacter sp. TaxID=1903157 RepID=UPI0035596D8E